MGTIADKLTYLNGTKQAIKEAINEDFEVINDNTTFRQYAEKISNNNEKYKSFIPTKTVNATNTVDISDGVDMKALVNQYGNTYQKTTTGKNMFDINATKTDFNIFLYKYEYQLKPNTQYTISSNAPVTTTANIYANSTSSTKKVCAGIPQTITSDNNGYFYILVRHQSSGDAGTFDIYTDILNGTYWLQIEEGSSATDYEEYTGGTASPNPDYPQDIVNISGETTVNITQGTEEKEYKINLPFELCKIGNYKDKLYNQNGKWYLHKEIDKIVFDGSESWTKSNSMSVDGYFGAYTSNYHWGVAGSFANKNNFIINYFLPHDNETGDFQFISSTGYACYLKINDSIANSVETLKTWLGTHNTIVYYVLVTPTTEEITESNYPTLYNQLNAIKLFKGTNHITITNESGLDVEFDIEYHYNVDEVLKTLTTVEGE